MNYIKQINHYWEKHEVFSLSGNECALYMYLLKRSNSSGWRNPNEVRNSVAMDILNLNFRELQASRDRLQQSDLIRCITRNGSFKVIYLLYDAESRDEPETFYKTFAPIAKVLTKVDAKVLAGVSTEVEESVLLNNKLKLKQEREPIPEFWNLEYFKTIGYDFKLSPALHEKINAFLKYRHDRKEPVQQGQVIESILTTARRISTREDDIIFMIDNTISRTAKNIITELPKKKQHDSRTQNTDEHGKIKVELSSEGD